MKTNKIFTVLFAVATLAIFTACTMTEGGEFKTENQDEATALYGYKTCTSSVDCGVGRFCDETTKLCTSECATSRDCYFYDEEAIKAWEAQKAEGISFSEAELPAPSYKCTECGTCIPNEQESDPRCVAEVEALCESDEDCTKDYGESYGCNQDGFCALLCEADQDCDQAGAGHKCAEDEGRKMCQKWCYDDSSCAYHGFGWKCELPESVSQDVAKGDCSGSSEYSDCSYYCAEGYTDNYCSDDSVVGRCVPRDTEYSIDWGEYVDETADNYKLVGVYGAINESAFTNCGFPLINCQDSTNIHHLLVRIRQAEDGKIQIQGKYCYHVMYNFRVSSEEPSHDETFKDYSWMEVPTVYTLSIPYHHWYATVDKADVGGIIQTDTYLEVRGAMLNDPAADPLPTAKDTAGSWDQDRDGKIGVTTFMNGVIAGEIYNDNRAFQSARFEIVSMTDENCVGEAPCVDKLKGLLTNKNESHVLGASKPDYMVDVTNTQYVDGNRSYMRMVRMPLDTTCEDIKEIIGVDNRDELNCDSDVNKRYLDVNDDKSWLCHTPTMDGPARIEDGE